MQLRFLALATGLVWSCTTWTAMAQSASLIARVDGQVHAPGDYTLATGARVSSLLATARPGTQAYLPGAALFREHDRLEQVRLRAGIEHDLIDLQDHKRPEIAKVAEQLLQWIDARDATGRVPLATTDVRLMQVQPMADPVLAPGDKLHFPPRPTTITVMGAVGAACELPHQPERDARDYLRDCSITKAADPSDLFVIQPDMVVQRIGIALWNRADPQTVAPGGVIYVPLREREINKVDPSFNTDFAAFIATQALTP
ncbi:capsule biosynthesis GfcC family protein [Stenotrophomonas sp. 364]|uniref:capsule biosynthesis GfcC family protein n=1 Tax=Stenotrophomonas sp. 364 TaxID=2691571 RepID=UPI0013180DE0|nr:capsule biosynthesis GfcC family protein [Stenotrophomonas sp. 364]QHB71208.1 hypothetical protein GQ674_07770 [Stenotrophomonas sp. 364]